MALDAVAATEIALCAEMHNAAAVVHAPQHLIIHGYGVQDIHHIEDDVRRAQHITTEIKNHLGARFHSSGEAAEAPILVGHHLRADEEADGLRHAFEIGIARRWLQALAIPQRVLSEVEHLTRIDPLRAGRDARATGRADLGPAPSLI